MTPIDVVLVAYRSDDVIEGAVQRAQSLGGSVVVVDHGDGESARLAAALGAVAISDPTNPGFGTGQNRGLAFTGSEHVLLCNPDAEIVPDAVLAGAELLSSRPDVAAVQGVIVNSGDGRPERSSGVGVRPVDLLARAVGAKALLRIPVIAKLGQRSAVVRGHADRVPSGPLEVKSLAATAVLVRRSAMDAVGGFDESYFLYGEDQDLCQRLRAAGWKLVAVPDVWARHVSGGSAASSWSRETNWWRGTMQFAADWWSRPAWTVALVSSVVRWARLAVQHPRHARRAFGAMVEVPVRRRAARARAAARQPALRLASDTERPVVAQPAHSARP